MADSDRPHLLDTNALIALGVDTHQHHATTLRWFNRHAAAWATCAVTQSAFIRILGQPAVVNPPMSVASSARLLRQNLAQGQHRLMSMDFGFDDVLACCTAGLHGHRQVTDAWLLTTAIRGGMKLLTFDAGVRQLLATEAERTRHVTVLR